MKVTNYVDAQINDLGLTKEDSVKIRTCIGKYSVPDSFLEKLVWLANRVANAVKRIFGRSDWQIATKILKNDASAVLMKLISTSPKDKQELAKKIAEGSLNIAANLRLETLVKYNENKVSSQEEEKEIDKKYFEDRKKKFDEAIKKANNELKKAGIQLK